VFTFAPDVTEAQTQCEQEFQACVRARRTGCEQNFQRCVLRKCPNNPLSCARLPECEAHCTESATSQGGIQSCCEGGPKHVNSCPNKIDGNCRPRQTMPPGGMMPSGMMMPPMMMGGGMPPMLPMIPMMMGGGGMMPPETPRGGCEAGVGFLADCPPVTIPPRMSLVFTANPAFVLEGASSTLSWTAENVSTCTASNGWSGLKSATGTAPVAPTTTTTYTLTCSGSATDIARSATITVFASSSLAATSSVMSFTDRITDALYQLAVQESGNAEVTDPGSYFSFLPIFIRKGNEGTIRHLFDGEDGTEEVVPEPRSFIDTVRQSSTFVVVGVPDAEPTFVNNFVNTLRTAFRNFLARWGL
jgi:hypothetical protein